jgi:hypothetical protein
MLMLFVAIFSGFDPFSALLDEDISQIITLVPETSDWGCTCGDSESIWNGPTVGLILELQLSMA